MEQVHLLRKLVLEAVQPLSGMKEFNRELPKFDPKAVQELPIGLIPAAESMHHLLLHSLLDLLRDEKNPVTPARAIPTIAGSDRCLTAASTQHGNVVYPAFSNRV